MEVTKKLEMAIANELQQQSGIEVYYSDGSQVSGFIKTAKFAPLSVTVCERVVERGANPLFHLDFDRVDRVELKYYDGTTKTFE
jgi:hypothetical protein